LYDIVFCLDTRYFVFDLLKIIVSALQNYVHYILYLCHKYTGLQLTYCPTYIRSSTHNSIGSLMLTVHINRTQYTSNEPIFLLLVGHFWH